MSLTNREKALLSILTFVVVIGGFLYFLIFPLLDGIKENRTVLQKERSTLEDLKRANETGTLTEIEKSLQEEMLRIEGILPTEVRIPEIYLDVVDVVKKTGVIQDSLVFQPPTIEAGIPATSGQAEEGAEQKDQKNAHQLVEQLIVFSMNHKFTGTYEEIQNYINEIQQNERKIDIIEYQLMHNSNSESSTNEIIASFILQSYALVREGQNYSEFVNYDFLQDTYGRSDPFALGIDVQKETINADADDNKE